MELHLLPLTVLLAMCSVCCSFLEPTIDKTCSDQPESVSLDRKNEVTLPLLKLNGTTAPISNQILQPRAATLKRQPSDRFALLRRVGGWLKHGRKSRMGSPETRGVIAKSQAQSPPADKIVAKSSFKLWKSQAQSSPTTEMVKALEESHTPVTREYYVRHLKPENNKQVSGPSSEAPSGEKTAKKPKYEWSSPTDFRAVAKKLEAEKAKRDKRRQDRRDKGLKSETPTPPTPPEDNIV